MKWIVALAFVAILASLAAAGMAMLRSRPHGQGESGKANNMVKALAWRVGLSVLLFVCVLLAWAMGYIQPTGITPGQ